MLLYAVSRSAEKDRIVLPKLIAVSCSWLSARCGTRLPFRSLRGVIIACASTDHSTVHTTSSVEEADRHGHCERDSREGKQGTDIVTAHSFAHDRNQLHYLVSVIDSECVCLPGNDARLKSFPHSIIHEQWLTLKQVSNAVPEAITKAVPVPEGYFPPQRQDQPGRVTCCSIFW
jgi:hypothetical protein